MLNKKELIDSVAKATGEAKRTVADVIDTTIDQIEKQVKKGQKVTIPGFGTFSRRSRKARKGRNPQTGELVEIPPSKDPAFKAGSTFKDIVR
ncbi:MAG: HU family DNA-binding protein [Actinomycetota bacterium]